MYQSFASLVAGAAVRLASLLGCLRAGSEADLVTPLVGKSTTDKRGKRYELAESVRRHCEFSQLPSWLRHHEQEQRRSHGAWSNHQPYALGLKEGVERFLVRVNYSIDRHAARVADAFVASRVKKGTLWAFSLDAAASSFEGATSYGWPFVSSSSEYYQPCLELSSELLKGSIKDYLAYPAILGTRGQAAGLNLRCKSRVVWQCSRVVANIEKMVFIPVFKALQHTPGFASWTSAMEVNHAITSMFDGNSCRRSVAWSPVMSVDFSKFDVTLPHEVIDRVYSIIRSWFRVEDQGLVSNLSYYVRHLSLITPEGVASNKARGIPSGSVMTNLVDSLCNLWVMSYAAARLAARVEAAEVQGDDGVYVFSETIDPVAMAQVIREELGMVINPEKGMTADNEVHFLQNVHRASYRNRYGLCVGVRPLMRILNGMMSYERFRPGWNSYLDSVRWAMQLSAAWEHPSFHLMAEWLLDKDAILQICDADEVVMKAGGPETIKRFLGKRYDGAVTFCDDVAELPGFNEVANVKALRAESVGR